MATKTVPRNVYDPRVRELVRAAGNPDLFTELARQERLAANRALSCEACTAAGQSANALVDAA